MKKSPRSLRQKIQMSFSKKHYFQSDRNRNVALNDEGNRFSSKQKQLVFLDGLFLLCFDQPYKKTNNSHGT